jgi:hypothetical protein
LKLKQSKFTGYPKSIIPEDLLDLLLLEPPLLPLLLDDELDLFAPDLDEPLDEPDFLTPLLPLDELDELFFAHFLTGPFPDELLLDDDLCAVELPPFPLELLEELLDELAPFPLVWLDLCEW